MQIIVQLQQTRVASTVKFNFNLNFSFDSQFAKLRAIKYYYCLVGELTIVKYA